MARPGTVWVFTVLLLLGGLLTGYAGLSAAGFLIPAVVMLMTAGLLWIGRAESLLSAILNINLVSGFAIDLVLRFGDGLGTHKLDVSAVAMLVNTFLGGPLLGVVGLPLQLMHYLGKSIRTWFARQSKPRGALTP